MFRLLTALTLLVSCCSAALAQADSAQARWEALIAAAKKEGRVVIIAPPDPQVRDTLPALFKARYGITVDYLGGRSAETSVRMRNEFQAGIHTVDVALSGIQTMAFVFYKEKMLDPLDDTVLIDPEVTDASKWTKGKLWFIDPEGKYILRLFSTVSALLYVNTTQVKPGEIRTAADLLDPKWKGRIVTHDPTVPGTGSNDAAKFYVKYGEPFVRKLFIDQKPGIFRDRRQITDGLSRGSYAIALGAEDDEMEQLVQDGLPVQAIYELDDLPGVLSAGVGQVALMSHAPHPNAAKLFVNWIASREGMEAFGRTRGGAPTRNDVDALKFLPAEAVPKPGVDYFDSYDWEFSTTTKEKVRMRMGEILRK
jgi:iron(III) transport system substrate-binding protein